MIRASIARSGSDSPKQRSEASRLRSKRQSRLRMACGFEFLSKVKPAITKALRTELGHYLKDVGARLPTPAKP